ncbi:protein WVD2-like 7 isoform X2 [Mercurialis annua]|uniref:protein WVD2-like 7 isoform X2 n=1 Tax=Mercurialis annua TaxID=3986 RepID=UPI00215EACB3|nr:protein WVD2-like 7 isoform X2 [Mercurialis annua]
MGEPTCLMHQQPFSYAAVPPSHSDQGNPVHSFGQSVSFGRFTSESLDWEKWSSFSHNRYVEEAERFSRPGSVAQKKAFFEAHYKNLAARKAAALLEQANANKVPDHEHSSEFQDCETKDLDKLTANSDQDLDEPEPGFDDDDNGHDLDLEMGDSESCKEEGVAPLTAESRAVEEDGVKVESPSQFDVAENLEEVKEIELSGSKLMEKPLLKDFISKGENSASISRKKPAVSSLKSLMTGRPSKLPCSPAKPAAPFRARKENNATPINKVPATDSMDRKKITPKSTHKSMNFTPVREINRLTSTIIRKIDNSRVGSNSKASKDCSTPLRTPTMVSRLRESKHPLATPRSEKRSTNFKATTPLHPSANASKTVSAKWHFLPTENKSQSPSTSTPFSLRTEERAARRKQKLEEKFNTNQAEKVQLQATLKEMAETEIKKLRRTLCFKARPLPNFYKESKALKNDMDKDALTQLESPNPGRTPIHSMAQTTSDPSQKPSVKNSDSKQITGKKSHNPRSLASRLREITRENTSPNIQHDRAANTAGLKVWP